MLKKVKAALQKPVSAGIVLLIVTVLITAQSLFLGKKTFEGKQEYTHYNNFKIFKGSYFHLVENKDLYSLYPDEHWDFYKYSPTFALFMAPLAYLPDASGLLFWNLLNVAILFLALRSLPFRSGKSWLFALGFILLELVTSLQNSQSNALIAGLIIFAFVFMERKQVALASLCIVLTVFIKIFGLLAFVLFIFYPEKGKALLYTIGWTLLLALLPLLVVSPSQLSFLYGSWLNLLKNDHSISYGLSVAGWLYSWFNLDMIKNTILVVGIVLFAIPLLKFRHYQDKRFRLLYLASVLIWVVIFNHKAESPTFIIAITGVAVWFFSAEKKMENTVLLILAFVFTVLSPTDVFPREIRETYIKPYYIKAVPCILVWLKIIYDLLVYRVPQEEQHEAAVLQS